MSNDIAHDNLGHTEQKRNIILSGVAIIILLIVIANIKKWFGGYVERVAKIGMIYAITTMALNLTNGCTGIVSLGTPAFMCIGAYSTAILIMSPEAKAEVWYLTPMVPWLQKIQIPFIFALLIGAILAAIIAFIIGFPVFRFNGDYLSIATLAFSEIIRVIILNSGPVTNGSLGITKIPNHVSIWAAFIALVITALFMFSLMRSSYGRAFKAIREDEIAAQAMGIQLFKHKMMSFMISAFFSAIAGGLLGSLLNTVDSNQFKFTYVYQFLLMLILGGQGSMSGAIVGAVLVASALEVFRVFDAPIDFGFWKYPGIAGMRMVIFSIALVIIVLFWRRGIFGDQEFSWNLIFKKQKNLRKGKSK